MVNESFKVACSKCGAQQAFSPGQRKLKCEFCSAETDIPRDEDQLSSIEEADFIVPLSIDKQLLEKITQTYMVTGDYTPDDLLEKSVITKQWLYYLPTYIFSGTYEAKWTATFGYDREEHYTEYKSVAQHYSDGRHAGYKQVPVTKTKTVTDWRPVNGDDSGEFLVQVYAGKELSDEVVGLVENAVLKDKLTAYKSDYLIGFEVEEFSVRSQDAYSNKGDAVVNSIIEKSVLSHAQGDRQRDWHWTSKIEKTTNKVLMPIAHSVFEYDGKEYHVWIDGSDESKMIGDTLPIDKNKKKAVYKGLIPLAILLLATFVFSMTNKDSVFNIYTFISLIIASTYALVRRQQMLTYSKAVRNSALTQKLVSSENTISLSEDDKNKVVSSFVKPVVPIFADTSKDKIIISIVSFTCVFFITIGVLLNIPSESKEPILESSVAEVAPAEVAPAEVAPAEVAPAEVAPAEVAPADTSRNSDFASQNIKPSFDCSKASTLIENLICTNNELSLLDAKLASSYQSAKKGLTPDGLDSLVKTQKQWLKNRNQCQSVQCLKDVYLARDSQLAPWDYEDH